MKCKYGVKSEAGRTRRCRRECNDRTNYCWQHGGADKSTEFTCRVPALDARIPYGFVCQNKYYCVKKRKNEQSVRCIRESSSGNQHIYKCDRDLKVKAGEQVYNCYDRDNLDYQIYYSWAEVGNRSKPLLATVDFLEEFQVQMLETEQDSKNSRTSNLRKVNKKTRRVFPYLVKQIKSLTEYSENIRRPKSQYAFLFANKKERMSEWGKIQTKLNQLSYVTYRPRVIFLITFYDDKEEWKETFSQRLWGISSAKVIDVPIYTGDVSKMKAIINIIYFKFIWNNRPDYSFRQLKSNQKP